MKTLILALICLSLLAGAAFAQSGGVTSDPNTVTTTPTADGLTELDWSRHRAVQPVPEPGTMALASMGLIALGTAARKRRK